MGKRGPDCIDFLKWALPQLGLRWKGYKKVRGQVCNRIQKRFKHLNFSSYAEYKDFLKTHQEEWFVLETLSHVTISRFFRDKRSWEVLGEELLPSLARKAMEESRPFRCWSAGCASGEEPYSFLILWKRKIEPLFPQLSLEVIATDTDDLMLKRAEAACYNEGSLRDLFVNWKSEFFTQEDGSFCLVENLKNFIKFKKQDIRKEMPDKSFDLIFCKNLVAMYFNEKTAIITFKKIADRMNKGTLLFLGNHEVFPLNMISEMELVNKGLAIYRKK